MKRTVTLCLLCLLMTFQAAMAEERSAVRTSVGTTLLHDPFEQEAGPATQLTLGYAVTRSFLMELNGIQSGDFKADNNMTEEKVNISIITVGGRYQPEFSDTVSGFVSLGAGMLRLDNDDEAEEQDKTRNGGVARFALGLDHKVARKWGLSWGAGFSRGLGNTNEISLFDVSVSLFFIP